MNCKDTQAAIDSASRRNPISQSASAHTAECLDCRRYTDQSNALLALLSTQPRVEAPADFDFRLRARIARAESQPSNGPVAVLANVFGLTFSFKQAAASLAALAVMAAATTFYFTNSNQSVNNNNPMIARVETSAPQTPPKMMEAPAEKSGAISVNLPKPVAMKAAAYTQGTQGSGVKIRPALMTGSSVREINLASNTINKDDLIRVYNRERGQVIETSVRPVLLGAESSVATAKPAIYAGF